MQKEQRPFYSHSLGRTLQLHIHGHWGYPILVFPPAGTDGRQIENLGLTHSVSDKIEHGEIKIYAIDSIDLDSFFSTELSSNSKIFNYQLYARFLKEELVPLLQRECNVHRVGLAGIDFGAYHALNFAFKYPDLTNFVISMSGMFDIRRFLDDYFDDNVYFNSPYDFIPGAESWIFNHLKIVLGTSDSDKNRDESLKMSKLLGQKQIDHWYDEKKQIEADSTLWNTAFPEYLEAFLY
ncbi:alpha/beta hydrolase-fold protein [Jiulongibacter sediminis]|uniref:Esterase n=1 Tax=Jiulongibacter sediminis TaxID=1605367 RepID=A0A0N8HAB3_9BACT|nr:alpha/beta hydrolase-fold protein [Jiulongibacter sediminis]KPM49692.1 esterase [Jiulongibacter sediminis]TBX26732.1 esterase [Jiulongibacter sediminis]